MISKNQIKLIQALHLKKNRDSQGLFIVEGIKLVTEFLEDEGVVVRQLFALAPYLQKHLALLEKRNIAYAEVDAEELKKISLQTTPNQALAVVQKKEQFFTPELLTSQLSLYLDDIRDPGNLGTIIRMADWFGIRQVICSRSTTELYNPKTLQASMGAVLRVNVIYLDFAELFPSLKGVPVYGAVLSGNNIYRSALRTGMIVIGNEANGISEAVLQHVTEPITIPAAGQNGSESLNAANACAIICSEFHRQLNYNA